MFAGTGLKSGNKMKNRHDLKHGAAQKKIENENKHINFIPVFLGRFKTLRAFFQRQQARHTSDIQTNTAIEPSYEGLPSRQNFVSN